MEKKQDELGALWERQSAKGKYMTGIITIDNVAIPIVCFTNQNMKNPKAPHWRILRSKPKEETQELNQLPTKEGEDVSPEDIPF